MKRLLILAAVGAAALVVGIAVAVAAGGSASSSKGAATVSVKRLGAAGKVLVDSKGRALYRNDQEHAGMVLCTGACVSFWRPLTVSGGVKGLSVAGKLAVIKRPDGGKQVTYNGKPLYTFTLDKPGKVTGDGAADSFGSQKFTWHVVHPGKSGSASAPASGPVTYPRY